MSIKITHLIKNCLKTIAKRENSFTKNESGQVLVFFAVIALLLVFFVGAITDYGQTVTKAINTQNSADAAALAAGSWVARGGNIQTIINGLHWDINLTLAQIITLTADICIIICAICLALSWLPFGVGQAFYSVYSTTRSIENSIISTCSKVHDATNKAIDPVQKIVVKATPIIAMLHANLAASNNGASNITELLSDLIDNFPNEVKNPIQSILSVLDEVQNLGFPISTWTLSPNLKMWENLQVTEIFKYEEDPPGMPGAKSIIMNAKNSSWSHPYRLNYIMPFTAIIPFWINHKQSLEWNDPFIIQKNKKKEMLNNSIDLGFDISFDISVMPDWFKKIMDELGDYFESLIDPIIEAIENFFGGLFDWIKFPDCFYDVEEKKEEGEEASSCNKQGIEDIAHFTFVTGFKSEAGVFLKLFGKTIDEDPDKNNVPITWALATVKVKGHSMHPGGLYKDSAGNINKLKLHIYPFWISSEPFFPQARLVSGYVSDWFAVLAPVQFQLTSGQTSDKDKEKSLKSKIFDAVMKKLRGKKKPKILKGKFLGINH